MGNCSSFTRALYTKNSSGGGRISFSGRTGPNSRVAPTSFPRQGSSGKSLSEKLIFFQHASRIGPTGEDTFCSRRFIFTRDTTRSEVGRQIKTFLKNWKKLTGEKKFGNCKGYKISYHLDPFLVRVPHSQKMNRDQSTLVNQEIESMLQKGAIKKVSHISGEFLSNLFLGDKSFRWRKEASDKPEKSKFVYTIPAIENRGPPSNKRSLAGTGLHAQDCSSRCTFYNTNKSKVQEIPQVQMGEKPVRVFCPCFGLGPAPLIFTILMKIPISLMRRINIRLIIYLGEILIMARPVQELIFHRDTVVYLLQNLGFVLSQFWNRLRKYNFWEWL